MNQTPRVDSWQRTISRKSFTLRIMSKRTNMDAEQLASEVYEQAGALQFIVEQRGDMNDTPANREELRRILEGIDNLKHRFYALEMPDAE